MMLFSHFRKSSFHISLADAGIDAEQTLSILDKIEGTLFGLYFYVKDANTIIIYYEGVFFESNRILEMRPARI